MGFDKSNKKIAIISLRFLPKWYSGTEIVTYKIAKYLSRNRYEVYVFTTLDKNTPRYTKKEEFFIHRLRYLNIKIIGLLLFCFKVSFAIKNINPRIVIIQGVSLGLTGVLLKKIFKIPYIVWCQGSDVFLSWKFKKIVSKIVFKNSNAIITTSDRMKNEINKIWRWNIFKISFGVDLEDFKNLSKKDCRRFLRISENKKIIIFVGRLHPVKGLEYLIEAMHFISKKIKDVNLLIVGDELGVHNYKKKLNQLIKKLKIKNQIIFVGKVPHKEVPKYLLSADVAVLPSISEGAINMEWMAAGLPIVATKVGGVPEFIKDYENGFLVEPRNSLQIAEKTMLLLENKELREKISAANLSKSKEFSWENVIIKLEELIDKIINFNSR